MKTIFPLVLCLLGLLTACYQQPYTPTADQKNQNQTEDIAAQGTAQVPLPTINHYGARRTMKAYYEAEDQQRPTYSYNFSPYHNCYVPLAGDEHTFGYPVPGATQMTNPNKLVRGDLGQYNGDLVMPQADPDTLFKPSSEAATLTMQLNPDTGTNDVTYSEPDVVTRTRPIDPKWVCKPNQ